MLLIAFPLIYGWKFDGASLSGSGVGEGRRRSRNPSNYSAIGNASDRRHLWSCAFNANSLDFIIASMSGKTIWMSYGLKLGIGIC